MLFPGIGLFGGSGLLSVVDDADAAWLDLFCFGLRGLVVIVFSGRLS